MSPVSRARKQPAQPSAPSVNGVFKDVLKDFSALGPDAGAFDVELLAAEVVGQWWGLPLDEDEEPLGVQLAAFAQRKVTPAAAALLGSLRAVAVTEEERKAAAAGLEVVLARGIPAPEWLDDLDTLTPGECWRTSDVYGDEWSLLCGFSRGEQEFGLLALLDFAEQGRVRDIVVVEEPGEVLAQMRQQAAEDPDLVVVEQLDAARANRLFSDGIALTDTLEDPDVSEDYARFHAIALAWCRTLPEAAAAAARADVPDTVVEEFVAASGLEDTESARAIGTLLLEHCRVADPATPLRVGPEKLARFLDGLLEEEHELDVELEEAVAPVVLAWARWTAARDGLSAPAVDALMSAVTEYLDEFDSADPALDAYLEDAEELSPEELAEVLERRMFAVPSLTTELGEEELELDPADPEQRRLLVIGEHPEYHESLAGTEFDDGLEEADRLFLALKIALVDQLWDGEPAELWPAVVRLRDAELDRDEIFDRLVETLQDQLRETDEDRLDYDIDAYRAALEELDEDAAEEDE